MNGVKTKLRNKMKTDMVNAVLNIRSGLKRHGKACYTYDLPKHKLEQIKAMIQINLQPQLQYLQWTMTTF